MTPRNPLDKKVIVDREAAERILKHLEMHSCSHVTAFRHAFIRPLEKALAQDNTGWAAVPVEATDDQLHSAWLSVDDLENWGVARTCYTAMLNASLPLLEIKRETK
jgi:hypothetical protein